MSTLNTIKLNNYNTTVTPWKAQSYGPTNSYKWNEITPATRVIYNEIKQFMAVLGQNCNKSL